MDYKDYERGQKSSTFWFAAKDELINTLLSKCCQKDRKIKILNMGGGTGDDLKILNNYGDVYVIDIDKRALDLIDKDMCFEKRVADARKLPYRDDFFDVVVSINLFEHIDEDALAVSEARRVLKKGGHLIFMVPAFQFLFSSHDKALSHKRRYSRKMVKRLLRQFNDLKVYYWNFFLFFPVAVMRLLKKNKPAEIDNLNMPRLADSFAYSLLKIENSLIKNNISLPLGVSLTGSCKK